MGLRKSRAALVLAFIALVMALGGSAVASGPRAHAASRGPRGPRGFRGSRGPAGPAGIGSIQTANASAPYCGFSTGVCSVASATATCPPGSFVTGGAANADTIETPISTIVGVNTYAAVSDNGSEFSGTLTVTAVCVAGRGIQFVARDRAAGDISAVQAMVRTKLAQKR